MNEDKRGLGLRWEHHTWPDGTPVLRADLRRGDLHIRFTLSVQDDGQLELAGLDMDDRLGLAGATCNLDEIVVQVIGLLLDAHREENPPCS